MRRQPFGGWKKSAIGAGTKAGGPNYLYGLGAWEDAPVRGEELPLSPLVSQLHRAAVATVTAGGSMSEADHTWLRTAFSSDAAALASEFGVTHDESGLQAERNILRYLPHDHVLMRLTADASTSHVLRALGAALAAKAMPLVSSEAELPDAVRATLQAAKVLVVVESRDSWQKRIASVAAVEGPAAGCRVRLVAGASREAALADIYEASGGKPDIAVYGHPPVSAGRVEMLPFLREQAVSLTAHRFGTPYKFSENVI